MNQLTIHKTEINIINEKMIICTSLIKTLESSLTGKNPPDEINVIAKFRELNDLIPNIFKIIKIKIVKPEYNRNILTVCFNVSFDIFILSLIKLFIT